MTNDVTAEEALLLHHKRKGKIEIIGKTSILNQRDLSICYTPGVAEVSRVISQDTAKSYDYTNRANTIVIISDGTRVLEMGPLGPEAEMPILEGKSLLFKKFGGVDAIPIVVASKDKDDIIKFAKMFKPSVAAIAIEDIESPKVFNITRKLSEEVGIPVFHDDREGTSMVVRAALINALKLVGKDPKKVKVVINGAGAAGHGISEILSDSGIKHIIVCDKKGAIYKGRDQDMGQFKNEIANMTNHSMAKGTLKDMAKDADVLIGVSAKGLFNKEIISSMAHNPIVFALANPGPEIEYEEALAAGAAIVATGRSDRPNQVNNYVAFPGFFRGLLSCRASKITKSMIIAASDAIASSINKTELSKDHIIPKYDLQKDYINLAYRVAMAVSETAVKEGVAKINVSRKEMKSEVRKILIRYNKIEKQVEKLNKKA
jgi:malate dehydrogenase (oxaloacetate-decarboxylating)